MATKREPEDAHLLAVARVAALATTTILIAFTVVTDALGRLLVDSTFHVSETLFISLVGAWTALLGLEGYALVRGHNGRDDEGP